MSEPDIRNYLQERFPEMTPITKPPPLASINGIGTFAYGRRDHDDATGTYVLTHFFGIVFIPLVALGAYRVADAPGGGWYFLGKVPLSRLAANWNWLLLLLIFAGAGSIYFFNRARDPEVMAAAKLAEADDLAAAHKVGKAAEIYRNVAKGGTSLAKEAADRVAPLLDNSTADFQELHVAFQVAIDLQRAGMPVNGIFERGLQQVRQRMAADPASALLLSETLLPLVAAVDKKDSAKQLEDARLIVLERLAQDRPNDVDVLSDLAQIWEARNELEKCEKLLAPHVDKLGGREGARILGQIYGHQDKLSQAVKLLDDYTVAAIGRLNKAEENRRDVIKRLDDASQDKLRSGKAPGFDFVRYRAADKKTQEKMVAEYLDKNLLGDPDFLKVQDAWNKEMRVVPAALDLGMALLRQGQATPDPDARKRFFEKAEQAFMSVNTVASQSAVFRDNFRLSLGQVYYWLGKHQEARKQFDEVLQLRKNDSAVLMEVAGILREVGIQAEARDLVEQAYDNPSHPAHKFMAAGLRALFARDQDDRVAWLEKTDPSNKSDLANLFHARGDRAMSQGNDADAASFFQQSIELYASLPESASTLNNGALVHFSLFGVTGERANYERGISMMEKAITLKPGDSIVIYNVAESTFSSSLCDVIGKDMDLSTLKRVGNLTLLEYLYDDLLGLTKYRDKVRADKGAAKALKYYDRVLLLAPKSPKIYGSLVGLHRYFKDLPAMRQLDQRLATVDLDLSETIRREKEMNEGKDDAKIRKDLLGSLARYKNKLDAARSVGGATFAAAVGDWVQFQGLASMLVKRLSAEELDGLVKLSEDALRQAPSRGSRTAYIGALLLRAHANLTDKTPAYAELVKKAERGLGSAYLIAYGLSRPGPVQDACLANDDVKKAIALLKDDARRYPDGSSVWACIVLKKADPDEAARIAQSILKNEVYRLNLKITETLNPLSSAAVLDNVWLLQLEGREQQATAAMEKAKKTGALLP